MKSDSFFCFGHKKGKSWVKKMNFKISLERPLLKRANRSRKERITLSKVKSDKSNSLPLLFFNEQKSEFPTLLKTSYAY